MWQFAQAFARDTSTHGFSRVVEAPSRISRILWILACLVAWTAVVWQFSTLLKQYYDYPTNVAVETSEEQVPFPAVTICNLRPFDFFVTAGIVFDEEGDRRWTPGNFSYIGSPNASLFERDAISYVNILTLYRAAIDQLYQDLEYGDRRLIEVKLWSRLVQLANVWEGAAEGSTQAKEFILDCMFAGQPCSWRDFKRIIDPAYLNCFVFDPMTTNYSSPPGGPENGLNLVLFVPSITALNLSTDAMNILAMAPDIAFGGEGVRLALHNQGSRAIPHMDGIDVPRGWSVTYGISGTQNIRTQAPYGNCSNEPYYDVPDGYAHSFDLCKEMCLQKGIWQKCGCVDFSLPFDESYRNSSCQAFEILPPECMKESVGETDLEFCGSYFTAWYEKMTCMENAFQNVMKSDSFSSECGCVPQCHYVIFKLTPGSSQWPLYEQTYSTLRDLIALSDFRSRFDPHKYETYFQNATVDTFTWSMAQHHGTEKNFLRLGVHISETTLSRIREHALMGNIDLMSNVGGLFGLWLGMSLLSVMEFLEFLAQGTFELMKEITGSTKIYPVQRRGIPKQWRKQ